MVYIETAVILALTLFNGVLAMSELAIVSSRRSRLDTMAASGSRGARVALELIEDPSRFLSTVQIGITLVGIAAGAFGGATLAIRLGGWLNGLAGIAPHGNAVAMTVVVSAITYVSLLIGELVPKRMALANPERAAAALAPAMNALSRTALPLVWLLTTSTEAVVRRIGLQKARTAAVTEEEVRSLIAAGTQAGIFVPQEREMIEGVMRLADRSVDVIMTPRPDIVWLDQADTIDKIAATIAESRHSRLLICRETVDEPVGVVRAKGIAGPRASPPIDRPQGPDGACSDGAGRHAGAPRPRPLQEAQAAHGGCCRRVRDEPGHRHAGRCSGIHCGRVAGGGGGAGIHHRAPAGWIVAR
jgi:putative hemolysin